MMQNDAYLFVIHALPKHTYTGSVIKLANNDGNHNISGKEINDAK